MVKAKLADGSIALAADLDADVLDQAVRKWMGDNPHQTQYIMSKIDAKRLNRMNL